MKEVSLGNLFCDGLIWYVKVREVEVLALSWWYDQAVDAAATSRWAARGMRALVTA